MSRKNPDLNINDILQRIGMVIQNHRNEAIAEALGASPSTASNWRTRNSIPWAEVYAFSKQHDLDFVWLLTGAEGQNGHQAQDTTALQEELKEAEELMQKYESIIKHYERIIEMQAKQIEQLSGISKLANHPHTDPGTKKKNVPF